jgi:hypothetical protein
MEKVKFFFQEALAYNNKVIEDLNSLNNKAFALLAGALPIFSAALGFLVTLWGKTGREAVTSSLVFACSGLGAVLILLLLAVFPRDFYRGEGAPEVFFSDNYYKADMYTIYTGSIASLHKYISYSQIPPAKPGACFCEPLKAVVLVCCVVFLPPVFSGLFFRPTCFIPIPLSTYVILITIILKLHAILNLSYI